MILDLFNYKPGNFCRIFFLDKSFIPAHRRNIGLMYV